MFKETKEGQTHSYNDGCGEPAHNQSEWEKNFDSKFSAIIGVDDEALDDSVIQNYNATDFSNLDDIKSFIETQIIEKLIEEIPDNFGYWIDKDIQKPIVLEHLKHQLKASWLRKESNGK